MTSPKTLSQNGDGCITCRVCMRSVYLVKVCDVSLRAETFWNLVNCERHHCVVPVSQLKIHKNSPPARPEVQIYVLICYLGLSQPGVIVAQL